jgi:RNA polymerase sigma-70 factor (ECF subfamily)
MRIRDPNDVESWTTFQDVYRPMLYSYCTRRGLQEADALDVVQEVLASVCRSIQKFEYQPEKGRFRAWLGTIAANEISSLMRKQNRVYAIDLNHASTDSNKIPLTDPDSDWVTIFSEHIFQTACDRVRSRVEAPTWECFLATWIQHQPAKDVAARLDIPIHSVYVNKSRVLKQLESEVLLLADDCLIECSEKETMKDRSTLG